MSTLLDRWRSQATLLDRHPRGYTPITHYDVNEDIQLIAGREMRFWRDKMGALQGSGQPVALVGGFAGLEGASSSTGASQPLPDALAAVTFVAGDFSPYSGTLYAPVPPRSPVHCRFYMGFTLALGSSPGTLLITPGVGTALSAKNLGAGVATATLGTSGTAFGMVKGELSIRGTGSGTDARWYYTGHFLGKLATSGAGTADVNQVFGYTAATGDSTAANGLWHTMTGTATVVTVTVQQLMFGSWN